MTEFLLDTNVVSELARPVPAAVAATHDLRLVTRNVADFAGFADLVVENWFA